MLGFISDLKKISAVLLVGGLLGTVSSHAQMTRRSKRESNANRQARIARSIEDTYSHRWEVAGGGGSLRVRSGPTTQRNNEITWAVSNTYYFNPKLGVEGDVRGSYGDAKVNNTFANIANPKISQYFIMGGPSYRFYERQHFALGAHALGGVTLGNFDGGTKGFPAYTVNLFNSGPRPTFSLGINFDYNFYPNLAFRITPTYIGSLLSSNVVGNQGTYLQNNKGVNFQVLYRFGRIK